MMGKVIILILITLVSIFLDAFSLGELWQHIKPFWILSFYIIFLLRYNETYAIYIALLLGVIVDIASSNILGQTSLALVITSGIVVYNLKIMRFSNTITLSIYILMLSIIFLLVLLIPQLMIHGFGINYLLFITPVTTTFLAILLSPLAKT